MLKLTCAMAAASLVAALIAGNVYAFDDEIAALVVDNGSGMGYSGFAGDDAITAAAVRASETTLPKHYTQTLLSTDQCGDMTVDDFFNHKFKTLDFKGTGKLYCNQTGTRMARAFAAADTNHDGYLTQDEFEAFKEQYGH